ncbi:MAG TPA: LCP family protein [Bacillales bacterium]|nr:LCP family protein [Bacillales bacterium]
MEDELKNLKKTLDESVYKGTHFTERHKHKVLRKIHSRTRPKPKRWMPYFSFAVCAALIVLVVQFAWHQVIQEKGQHASQLALMSQRQGPVSVVWVRTETKHKMPVAMMLLNVDPIDHTATLLSLPRDLKVGREAPAKLSNAFRVQNPESLTNTVGSYFDIDVDYYLSMDNEAFADIINTIGGITVQNHATFRFHGYEFPKGKIELNGKEALAYSSMYKKDPAGMKGRLDRQRQVLRSVVDKITSLSSANKLKEVFAHFQNGSKTNMSFRDMMAFYQDNKNSIKDIEVLHLDGSAERMNGLYYFTVSEKEKHRVSALLRGK